MSFLKTIGVGGLLLFFVFFATAFVDCGGGDNKSSQDATVTPAAPAVTPTAAGMTNEQLKVDLLKEVDAKIAVAQGDTKKQLQDLKDLIAKTNADTVVSMKDFIALQLKSFSGAQDIQVRATAPVAKVPGGGHIAQGTMPAFTADISHGGWSIKGTDRLDQNPVVKGWLTRIKDPAPALWRTFPNIPNPDVPDLRVVNGTQVPDGMEYGTYSSPFCFSHPCDLSVGAWEYRYISGDYQFLSTECHGDMKKGCMLVLINVMDQSFTWRNQDVDNGFTLRGRYFNGDTLEMGVWGLVSHGSANMLNLPTLAHPGEVLNAGAPGNSGANCGTPLGCGSVDVTVVVHAGDAIIAVAKTTVTK